ncbi:hypothetical protein ESZ36_00345 [Colwellia demingiae]|uniref:Uncharacterized protein n=1 Tax=Colwellia demingiae TaxID=89401 RepID=A0A5C6QT09_9GAMM|nr:hypothetical protein [Colwellia demingiae]TWX71721.1 hypothetical protein ESZ36_00345 [Colwellia demingiae]
MDCKASFGGDNTEMLLIPNVMVACLYHDKLTDSRNLSLPVGYISFDPKMVSYVTDSALSWAAQDGQFNHYFEKQHTEDKDKILNKYLSPILMQDSGMDKKRTK